MNRLFLLFLLSYCSIAFSQEQRGGIRVMFYNVENLFDTTDDPLKNDNEFTPDGEKHWNDYRYKCKLNSLFKVISNVGEWIPPEIIGLCEVENKDVMLDLINKTPLYKYDYGIAHFESPDYRGIDVGCIYNKNKLKKISSYPIPVIDLDNPLFKTRDILYVSFETENQDTLHLYINHWPSRRGGEIKSEPLRMIASNKLVTVIDSTFQGKKANIMIVGDFNDDPNNKSIENLVKCKNIQLMNLSGTENINFGTIKFNGLWNTFDQIIVSESLRDKDNNLYISSGIYNIANFKYLFDEDNTHRGIKPFPTYRGPQYVGGFSDHLPVYIDISLN